VWVTSSLSDLLTPTAIALGNFDGLHLGHQKVLRPILPRSSVFFANSGSLNSGALDAESSEGLTDESLIEDLYPTVVTFHPHPKAFFTGEDWKLLTPLSEKIDDLAAFGIKQLVRLPFNARLASLSPQDFVKNILVERLQARRISIGSDFCFGYQRQGTAQDLQAIAQTYGIEVTITPLFSGEDFSCDRISSSRIREALAIADLAAVTQMLGRPYQLQGTVVLGQQLGRTLGFPTANLQLPPDKLLPRLGVYGVRAVLDPRFSGINWEANASLIGVMNLGLRPTIAGQTVTAEVHLLDWTGDLYGKTLTVFLETFLRSEKKFASLDELKVQIALDCQQASKFFDLPQTL